MADQNSKFVDDLASLGKATIQGGKALATINEARNRRNALATNNQLLIDRELLNPVEFLIKHGTEANSIMNQVDQGQVALEQYKLGAERTGGEAVNDTVVDLASGVVNSVGGIAALGAGIVNPQLGAGAADLLKSFNDYSLSEQSQYVKRNLALDGIRSGLDEQDNTALFDQDVKEDGSFLAGLKYLGRDVAGGVSRVVENPALAKSTIAQGVGSLLTAGPLGKVVSAVGVPAKAAIPTAIGAMEAGGAYSGTVQEIMGRSHEDLLQTSPDYAEMIKSGMSPDQAKTSIADNAGKLAASIQGPVGAVLGKGVAAFEAAPLALRPVREAVGNLVREGVEEGAQSATGQVSQNLGVSIQADPNQGLLEGAGSQAVLGVVGGVGSAGAVQAPGASLKGLVKGTGLAAQMAMTPIRNRYEAIKTEINKNNPTTAENMAPMVAAAAAEAPQVATAMRKAAAEVGASGEETETFISKIQAASTVQQSDIDMMPEEMRGALGEIEQAQGKPVDRFQALSLAAMVANNTEQSSPEDRVAAATYILKNIEENKKLFLEDLPEFMSKISHETEEAQQYGAYSKILTDIESEKGVKEAITWARTKMQMADQDLSAVDLSTPEGKKIVDNAINVATVAPQALNLKTAEFVLAQADAGALERTPEERRVLRGAISLVKASRLHAARMRVPELAFIEQDADEVQTELASTENTDEMLKFVGKQIATEGGAKASQLSLLDHVAGINLAVSQGDKNGVRAKVQHLASFAQSHINKLTAINQSLRNNGTPFGYKAFSSAGEFYDSPKKVGARAGNAGQERFARTVYSEAIAIAQLANDFIEQNPGIGIKPRKVPELVLDNARVINKENTSNNGDNKNRGSSTTAESKSGSLATTSRTEDDDTSKQLELPLSPSQPAREPETPAPANGTSGQESTDQDGNTSRVETVEVEEVVEPEIETETTTQPEKTVQDEPEVTEPKTLKEMFSSLVQPKGRNRFLMSFKLPKTAKSRLALVKAPWQVVYDLMNAAPGAIHSFIGKKTRYELNVDLLADYQELLDKGDAAREIMVERLKKKVTPALLEKLEAGDENVIRTRDNRILNILEKTNTGYRYNPELVETAIIASLDWVLNVTQRNAPLKLDDVAKILGIDESEAGEFVEEMNRGMSLDMASRTLARHIQKFWGVEADVNARKGFTEGIPEAVAKEVLVGLESVGLLELGNIKFPKNSEKQYNRVWFDTRNDDTKNFVARFGKASEFLADLILVDREIEGYSVGTPVLDVDRAQLHNSAAPLSRKARKALENAQKTPYEPNQVGFAFDSAMGEERYVTLMSGKPYAKGDLDKKHTDMGLNVNDWRSIQGKQRGLVSAFNNVAHMMEASKAQGFAPLFFKHHNNKLGRPQMDGLSNPQTSKYARELFSPTTSVLDLTDTDSQDYIRFMKTIGQGIGFKTELKTGAEIKQLVEADTMTQQGKFFPLVQDMKAWLKGDQKAMPDALFEKLVAAKLTDHGRHALLGLARYEVAKEAGDDLTKFETKTYLEADGKTNGPINTLMMFASGAFTPAWLKAVGKGGAFFGALDKTLASHEDKEDLYKGTSVVTQVKLADLGRTIEKSNVEAFEVFGSFMRIMNVLNANVIVGADGSVTLDRGLTKNPLTITVYGSGADGIAGKISGEIVRAIYTKLSESIASETPIGELVYGKENAAEFYKDLATITSHKVRVNKDTGKFVVWGKYEALPSGNAQDFTLDKDRYLNLRGNMLTLLVTPMVEAINQEVTKHVSPVTKAIQQATQIQSIIAKSMFMTEIANRLALMKSDPEKYDYVGGEFLSEKELREIMKKIEPYLPIIKTDTQNYMLSGGETSDLFDGEMFGVLPDGSKVKVSQPEAFSSSIAGDMRTNAYVDGPTVAGVKAIPTLVIGSGDAQMMMNFLADNSEAAQRVLHVFDGLNMPAAKIEEYSKMVNKAVFQTWTSNTNPVRAVFESFKAFMGNNPFETLFPDTDRAPHQISAIEDLSKVNQDAGKIKERDTDDVLKAKMNQVLQTLSDLADDTDARRQVISEMPFSVDQMASGETPYVNQGTIKLPENPTPDQIAFAMEARRREILGKPAQIEPVEATPKVEAPVEKQKKAPVKKQSMSEFIDSRATFDGDTGAQVMNVRQLTDMAEALSDNLSETQKEMLENAVENLRKKNALIIFGNPKELDAWSQVYSADRYFPDILETSLGMFDPVNGFVYVSNLATPETLIHELIHASTFELLTSHYNGEKLSKERSEAIVRLEGLMGEWLAAADPDGVEEAAVGAVRDGLRSGNKAAAVNEFMAWVLGNQLLARAAAKQQVKNPIFKIIGEALKALSTLIFGKEIPAGDDVLSQLRFNTRILMAPSPVSNMKSDFRSTVLEQSASFGSSDRLTNLREIFNQKVIAWIGDDGQLANVAQVAERRLEASRNETAADDIANSFARFFPSLSTMQGFSTFSMIQQALMTEAELNPNALSRVEELYTHVMKTMDSAQSPTSFFRTNEDPNDQQDATDAQNKYDAVTGVYGFKTDAYGRSTLMSSFLALAMVDDQFRDVLSKMEKPKAEKNTEGSLDALLENTANSMMDGLSRHLAGEKSSDKNVKDALDRLTQAMINNVGDQRSFIEQRTESFIDRAENTTADKIQEISGKVAEKSADIARNSNSLAVKALASVTSVFATLINEEKSDAAALGLSRWLSTQNTPNILVDLVRDVFGRNEDNAAIFDMISKVRSVVQRVRQQFRDDLPGKLAKAFTRKVEASEWTAMFKALGKTDIALLGADDALRAFSTPAWLKGEIQNIELSIQALDNRRFNQLQARAKQLGKFMVTGEHGPGLLRNAEAIARLLGSQMANANPSAALVESLDRLVTLYAIEGLDQTTKDTMTALLSDQEAGVRYITDYLVGQRVEELGKIGSNMVAKLNHYKGNIPSEVQQGGSLIIADEAEHEHLILRGYKKVGDYEGSSADRVLGNRAYYFAPVSGQAIFSQGVLQTVHMTVSGVDPETGFTVGEVLGGRISDPRIVRLIERQLANQRQTKENLLPVWDEKGKLVAYERAADPEKLAGLHKSTDLAEMIGVWRGRQAEEMLANQVNIQLVDTLHDLWEDAQRNGRRSEFVNIAALDPRTDDPVLIEAARLIPNQTKDYIKAKFGQDEFWVNRSMLLDTFGARQASIGDLFTGKTRWNPKVVERFEKLAVGIFGKDAYQGMVSVEKNIQELVGNAKTRIVVQSVIVPAANLISNMFQLLNRGVPLRHILKGVPAKTAEINHYIQNRSREVELEADLRAAQGRNELGKILRLKNELRSIQDGYKRMSIWPLIEAGEFSAISNGQVTAEDLALADGKWTNWVERKIAELPTGLSTIARYGLVTRDTALFQGLARSVQYGDFVAKAILYDDLAKRKRTNPLDAIATVNEAFVNYNRLAGRDRQYLESIGLLWFWNYKLRIIKEAAWTLRHNPLRSLLMLGVPVGSPIGDNFVTVFLGDRLGWSMGPSMGWNSLSLNPWVNLTR